LVGSTPLICLKSTGFHKYLTLLSDRVQVLTEDLATALYYEQALAAGGDPKEAAKWLTGTPSLTLKLDLFGLDE
jgi:Asp-tRNA(Asn)/Glu-tRNA(Gln) amidotransferase B subunit